MLNWEENPKRTERGIQMLLRRKYPGLRSLDGAGGDGGRDAQLFVTADDRTVFEIKSFGRLNSSRRRQVERSLRSAVTSAPDMARWILVIPMNMTPARPGVRSSEETWFDNDLPRLAPGVDLTWWGLDWLDGQIAENVDLQRYIEGADGQLLQRASELGMEQAVLGRGSDDLEARLRVLRRRVDEISPFWTLDFAVRDGVQESTLRGKVPDAHLLDPITITPTFRFRGDDPTHQELQHRFERTLAFGGTVEIPAGHVTEMKVIASPEARLLLGDQDPVNSEFILTTPRDRLDRPIRCAYQVLSADDQVVAQFHVFLRERTVGARGVTLFGGDAADVVTIEMAIPRPEVPTSPGEVIESSDTHLKLTLPETAAGFDVDSLLPVLRTLGAATAGNRVRVELPGLGFISSGPSRDHFFGDVESTHQVVEDLYRMQQVTGSVLRFPPGLTVGQVRELRDAVRQLDDEVVEHEGGLTLNLQPRSVGEFLSLLDQAPAGCLPGGLFSANDNRALELGDLVLPYGPAAFWAPHPKLVNRPDLEAAAASPTPPEGPVEAQFEPTDIPFRWMPRSKAVAYFESGVRPSDNDL